MSIHRVPTHSPIIQSICTDSFETPMIMHLSIVWRTPLPLYPIIDRCESCNSCKMTHTTVTSLTDNLCKMTTPESQQWRTLLHYSNDLLNNWGEITHTWVTSVTDNCSKVMHTWDTCYLSMTQQWRTLPGGGTCNWKVHNTLYVCM